jgi:hypothetical protein
VVERSVSIGEHLSDDLAVTDMVATTVITEVRFQCVVVLGVVALPQQGESNTLGTTHCWVATFSSRLAVTH